VRSHIANARVKLRRHFEREVLRAPKKAGEMRSGETGGDADAAEGGRR
jgi:hypothetical protein